MGTIASLAKGLRSVNLPSEIPKMIDRTKQYILSLNQDQLYKESIDSLGAPLQLYKSVAYSFYKQTKNPGLAFGRPDLKDTGAFYSAFQIDVGYTGIYSIYSTDSKAGELEAKYTKYIYGLTPGSRSQYAAKLYEFEFKPYCKVLFAMNKLPLIRDR